MYSGRYSKTTINICYILVNFCIFDVILLTTSDEQRNFNKESAITLRRVKLILKICAIGWGAAWGSGTALLYQLM